MPKTFPKFANHDEASCFNCGGDFYGEHWMKSGHAPNHGEFVTDCCKCGMATWYDLNQERVT